MEFKFVQYTVALDTRDKADRSLKCVMLRFDTVDDLGNTLAQKDRCTGVQKVKAGK